MAFPLPMIDRLQAAYQRVRDDLLARRTPAGHWVGELSSSALSTATAISALALVARHATLAAAERGLLEALIRRGLHWLTRHQNADGGFGDTPESRSNIATTMLVRAAFHLAAAPVAPADADRLEVAAAYIAAQGGQEGLRRRYGRDKTFAVPILTNCALAGLAAWSDVDPLPFELACLPHPVLRFLRLPVVSYAVPALVAIGQARYFHAPPPPPLRWLRRLAVGRSLETLARMQPDSGGFLEAAPLTSFVVMSLASIGRADHPVVRRGVEFLKASVRADGSWPIDTNLATWTTTLAINALAAGGDDVYDPAGLAWLLTCQHRQLHPFTHAAPGGWAWTDLTGGVPDADDTPGALLALAAIEQSLRGRAATGSETVVAEIRRAVAAGLQWLLDLQNADGGWPTFCRGWGALPFDRSGVDLTAHAVRALHAWRAIGPPPLAARIPRAIDRGMAYIARQQRGVGSWVPLWFGNQHQPGEENPFYGTGKVLLAYRDLDQMSHASARRGLAWLAAHQAADGGWGGSDSTAPAADSSVEETSVALEALLAAGGEPTLQHATRQGLNWLVAAVEAGRYRRPAPIGLYFARLWYDEALYPLVFAAAALGRAVRQSTLDFRSPAGDY